MAMRWGITGVSKIAHDFCIAITSKLTTSEHEIIAIASRSKLNAYNFAKTHSIAAAYGTYEELAKDPNVEVVYVTVLNPQHYAVCKMMIEHGKHVVCEKPFCMNYTQAKELITLAEQRCVFIMEGLWSRFFPVYRHLAHLIDIHGLGDIKEIYVKHGFNGTDNGRIVQKEMGGGIVLDIGCYALQFVLLVFREAPKSIRAQGKVNSNGVDLYFEAELTFSAGKTANIICSGLEELENQATIISTKGPICVPTYWCPTRLVTSGHVQNWPLIDAPAELNYTNSMGLKYEADEVKNCIRSGKLNCHIASSEDTLLIAQIQDEIRKQIGVRYECDKQI